MNNMHAFVTDPVRLEQHSLLRSVILHLLPGALIVTSYIIAARRSSIWAFRQDSHY